MLLGEAVAAYGTEIDRVDYGDDADGDPYGQPWDGFGPAPAQSKAHTALLCEEEARAAERAMRDLCAPTRDRRMRRRQEEFFSVVADRVAAECAPLAGEELAAKLADIEHRLGVAAATTGEAITLAMVVRAALRAQHARLAAWRHEVLVSAITEALTAELRPAVDAALAAARPAEKPARRRGRRRRRARTRVHAKPAPAAQAGTPRRSHRRNRRSC